MRQRGLGGFPHKRLPNPKGEEETAFRVAWSAVKRDYEKGDDEQWHKKPE
jgi:cation transport regulator ChaB